jgi:hypothetical protein
MSIFRGVPVNFNTPLFTYDANQGTMILHGSWDGELNCLSFEIKINLIGSQIGRQWQFKHEMSAIFGLSGITVNCLQKTLV